MLIVTLRLFLKEKLPLTIQPLCACLYVCVLLFVCFFFKQNYVPVWLGKASAAAFVTTGDGNVVFVYVFVLELFTGIYFFEVDGTLGLQ